jgi:hypothetical protein
VVACQGDVVLSRHVSIMTNPKVCHYSAQSLGSFAAQPLDVLRSGNS